MRLRDLDPDEFDDDALAAALRVAGFDERAAFAAKMSGALIARLARICGKAWPSSTIEAQELLAIAGQPEASRALIDGDRQRRSAWINPPQERKTATLVRPSVLIVLVREALDAIAAGSARGADLRALDVLRATPRFVVDDIEAVNAEILREALIELRLAVLRSDRFDDAVRGDAVSGLAADDPGALLLRSDALPADVLLNLLRRVDAEEAYDVVVGAWAAGKLRPSLIYNGHVVDDERYIDLALSTLRDDPRWSLELLAQHRAPRARQELEAAMRVLIREKAPSSSLSALAPDLVDDVVMGLVDRGDLSRDEVDAFFFA